MSKERIKFLIGFLLVGILVLNGCVEQFPKSEEKITDCGEINESAIIFAQSLEEHQKLSCINDNIINCRPAKLTIKVTESEKMLGVDFLSSSPMTDFQVKGVGEKGCLISATIGKRTTTCDIPTRVINDLKDELKEGEEGMEEYLVWGIYFTVMYRGGGVYTTKNNECMVVECESLPPLTEEECEGKETEFDKTGCYSYLAKERRDYKICEKVTEGLFRDTCYAEVALLTENYELCEMIEDDEWREGCYNAAHD